MPNSEQQRPECGKPLPIIHDPKTGGTEQGRCTNPDCPSNTMYERGNPSWDTTRGPSATEGMRLNLRPAPPV
jgi:hypothetical protein